VVADVGAGTGYFSVRLARAVARGKVFASDIEPDMVRYLRDRARAEGLANLVPVEGSAEDPRIPEPVDVIFVCNVYHHIAAGLPVNSFGPRLSFFFAAHNNLFEEAAKFRAARRLWARLMQSCFGADDKTARLRFHTQTGGVTLQAQQPLNNVVRVTVQALSAVLGGTQSLHTNGFDEALALPTADAATLALRTQQVLGHESGVADVIDPLGGSYYVEALTDRLEAEALALIEEVDRLGGAAEAVAQGHFQEAIARSAWEAQQRQEAGTQVVVGVNQFTDDAPPPVIAMPDFAELAGRQLARLNTVRTSRNGPRVRASLEAVRHAATTTQPMMPPILEAVRNRATLGEISETLREVWGSYHPGR
jgi:methylmalonyl-CoA mutase N-terminal domain/subunit